MESAYHVDGKCQNANIQDRVGQLISEDEMAEWKAIRFGGKRKIVNSRNRRTLEDNDKESSYQPCDTKCCDNVCGNAKRLGREYDAVKAQDGYLGKGNCKWEEQFSHPQDL